MIALCIKNSLTTHDKCKLRYFKTSYTFNNQDDGARFFVIVKMVLHNTRTGWSYIKSKMDTIEMSQFKHDIPRYNLQIVEFINEIFIAGETYWEIGG